MSCFSYFGPPTLGGRGFLSAALLGLVSLLLLVLPAAAQDQKPVPKPAGDVAQAIIEAPEEPVAPGRLVIIDATQSIGSVFLWSANEPYPAPDENWAIDTGTRKVHFATPLLPGKYAWTLTVIMPEAMEDAGKGDQTQVVILVGDAPPPPPPAELTIKLAKLIVSEADNGGATSGTITREAAGTEDLPIAVTSSDPDVVTVTPLVTIPVGETSVGFLVNAIDNDEENEDRTVTITAKAQGYEPVTISLTVTDDDEETPPLILTLTVNPTTFKEGEEASAVIRREGGSSESLVVVNLVSSHIDEATVPATVSIPVGQLMAAFEVAGVADGEVDGDQKVTITATCGDNCKPSSVELTIVDVDEETPPVTALWGIVVHESGQRDEYGPQIAQVIVGARLDTLDADFVWLPFDLDEVDEDGNTPEEFEPWVQMLTAGGFETPHLFLVQQEGKLVDHMKLPGSVDAVIAEVRKHLPE